MERYHSRALGPATWDAYAALVERHNGVWGGCWCLVFHEGQKKDAPDERRARKRAMVAAGRSHAALVFDGARAIGWAQYGARDELRHIKNRRAYDAGAGDEAPADWRITCFFVDRDYRRQGVGAQALRGALDMIAEAGGGTVEAFPEALEGQKTSAGFLWNGTLGMFERAGFAPARKIGKHRWVVRRTVEGALR
ncbi:MAG: GNAT family N-acetyltransferase [Maritimibacter sp.]|nr:GNAT family N-acetyltransferase [Maritimibacter sp.]